MTERIKEFFGFIMFTVKIIIVGFAFYGIISMGYHVGVIPKKIDDSNVAEVGSNSFFETVGNKVDSIIGNPPEKIVYTYDGNRYVYKLGGKKEELNIEEKENDGVFTKISNGVGNSVNKTKEVVGGLFTNESKPQNQG